MEKIRKAQMQQFAWLFSVIVGAMVLLLAFFFVTQYSEKVERPTKQTSLASGIDILLEPFSSIGSLAEMRAEPIELPKGVYIEFSCNSINDYSEIKAREEGHRKFDLTKKVYDKYIFAKPIITSKRTKLFAFSLPIKIPFYVVTATVIVSNDTCLSNLPLAYRDDLKDVYDQIKDKVDVKLNFSGCQPDSTINNNGGYGKVGSKQWIDGLILAAVFSSDSVYNCNLQRILDRAERLAEIYREKAQLMQQKGCETGNVINILDKYINAARSGQIEDLYQATQQLKNANNALSEDCKLFPRE